MPETAKGEAAVAIESLVVRYGSSTVLQGVSLHVAPGSVHALIGRNGVGKSSLVRCLLGQQKPQGGTIKMFGQDVWRARTQLMARVGVVPETPDAPPRLDARALSRFCSRLYPRWDDAALRDRLDRFAVPLDVPFSGLSRGQRAQVMLALALAHGPELLVLDDPTLGLDVVARRAVFEELVVEMADRGITVLITSHDLAGIERIATHITVLDDGALRFDEPLESLKARFRRLRFGPGTGADRLRPMQPLSTQARGRDTEAIVAAFDPAAFETLAGSPGIERAEAEPVSLEDILVATGARPSEAHNL